MAKYAWVVCLWGLSLYAVQEEDVVKRIHNHLLIQDPFSAVQEARQAALDHPQSTKVSMAYLEALCAGGEEVEAFETFLALSKSLGQQTTRPMFELLAWGVLNKGDASPLVMVRFYSLLGAAFTQDARALPILLKELKGSNALLRSMAVKLSASYGDAPLQEELKRLLTEEKVWFVRLEVIKAIGALRIRNAQNQLKEIIAHPKTLAEEKVAAIFSLVHMYDALEPTELDALLHSERAGLRELACQLIAHLDLRDEVPKLVPLLSDANPDVRVAAMRCLGFLQIRVIQDRTVVDLIQKNLEDPIAEVSITAGWLATVLGAEIGIQELERWLEQDTLDAKRLAAAAVAVTGSFGVDLAAKEIRSQIDPYTKVNLAIGLIGQKKERELASQVLFQELIASGNNLWMWEERAGGLFRSLAPSKVRHIEQIPRYPDVVDQLVKLDILSILSIVRHPKALEAVKEFLKNQSWGVTGAAAATLLEEGDESALDEVRLLLSDPDDKIRIQAALILALVGSDISSVSVLMDAYGKVDREMKIYILEALGHIGDPSSIPFLVEVLKEPFQTLRVVAASALIQCLYH